MQLSFFIKGQNCPNTRQPSHCVLRIDLKKGENRVYIFPSHLFERSLVDGFELSMCQGSHGVATLFLVTSKFFQPFSGI